MKLNEVLTMMAAQVRADAQALIGFAAEDTLGGYDIDERNRKFPIGSLWEPEGKILYALVRWLKPDKVVEVGGWAGCSAAHMALAVKANGRGKVFSVDNWIGDSQGTVGAGHGDLIPVELRQYVELVKADGRDWLDAQDDNSIGLVFEDADHSTELTAYLSRAALQKLEAGGVLVNHDAAHDFAIVGGGQRIGSTVGLEVRAGLEKAGLYFRPYLAEPSDCGVAITVKPGVRNVDVHSVKADERPVNEPLPQLGPDKDLITEVPRQVGNANIESDGLLNPSAASATEEDTTEMLKHPNIDMRELAPLPPGLRGSQSDKQKPARKRK